MTERVANPDELVRQAYATAVQLLTSRDHSSTELRQKLVRRKYDKDAIEAALLQLQDANYLNDSRYAELYAEQRMNQGYGPLSIRAKLVQRGIDTQLASHALNALNTDWSQQAQASLVKRFDSCDILDTKPRSAARIARFLQSRGYASSDALRALQRARRDLQE